MKKRILIAGAGGFIGGHLAKKLSNKKNIIFCVDKKPLKKWYQITRSNKNIVSDLTFDANCKKVTKNIDEVYNLACDMGGMGFIENFKAQCMLSVLITTNLLKYSKINKVKKFFYSSSACVYPNFKQTAKKTINLKETDVYPADPMDGYGWEKLYGEKLCENFQKDYGIKVRVARFHNTYGPFCSWNDGREKAPAALARKFIEAKFFRKKNIEIWGDGSQKRSYTYIDDCLTGIQKIVKGNYSYPINLGTSFCVSVNQLVDILEKISNLKLKRVYIKNAPKGVQSRNSDNKLIKKLFNWEPKYSLEVGMENLYRYIYDEFRKNHRF